MKVYREMQVLCLGYCDRKWIGGLLRIPYHFAHVLARIKAIIQTWFYNSSESAENFEKKIAKNCERSQVRILNLQKKISIFSNFVSSRPDLQRIIQADLEKDHQYIVQDTPPEQDDDSQSASLSVIDTWDKLLEQENYLRSRWDELEYFVKSHRDIKKCFAKHIKALERAENISKEDREFLHLMQSLRKRQVVILGPVAI